MKDTNTASTKLSFFAAANGYSGFRSYFSKIFAPDKYSAIYILKGGPGTGKSSFMKRLLAELESTLDGCEAIHCSSDTRSLDGIILRKGASSIAVIDGTAPHATDPIFPGAVDKIINLGEHWDEKILTDNQENIKVIGQSKKKAYKSAYDYLSIAGEITKTVDESLNEIYTDEDEDLIASLLSKDMHKKGTATIRLLTSYGKDGIGRLDTLRQTAEKIYSAVGVYGSEYIFMSRLYRALEYAGEDYILFPSALDENKIYALFIPSRSIAFVAERLSGVPDERVIDTSRFLDENRLSREKERLEFLWREREAFLWSSADQFKKASDEHFKLEKIYTAAMDFSKIDEVYALCVSDIKKKLGL